MTSEDTIPEHKVEFDPTTTPAITEDVNFNNNNEPQTSESAPTEESADPQTEKSVKKRRKGRSQKAQGDGDSKQQANSLSNKHLNMIQRSHLLAACFEARGRLCYGDSSVSRMTIELYNEIVSNLGKTSDVHGLSGTHLPTKETIRSFLKHFETTGSIEPKKSTGRKTKIPDEVRERLCQLVLENYSYMQAQAIILEESGVYVGKSTASNIIRERFKTKRPNNPTFDKDLQ